MTDDEVKLLADLIDVHTLEEGEVLVPEGATDRNLYVVVNGVIEVAKPEEGGKWTVLRFVSRNNGASTRPAPDPGIGFECDKFDAGALDAHFADYGGKLLQKVGPRARGRGWTMLHIDSWEMGAQNWSPAFREEFRRRRGYDPFRYLPVLTGVAVDSARV
ncbi:MAG: hypothetical protein MUF80_06365, partial [Burkholderiales bacterium]|nr:hypothetical protein [Burkholderiales bacterium]